MSHVIKGVLGAAIPASFPSLISLGLRGIILSFGSSKPFTTLSFIVLSPLFGFKLSLCIFMARQNIGSLQLRIS